MEQRRGQGVRLSDIAQAAGISRQAVYLHFSSRAELLVATVRYVDQVHDLDERLSGLRQASGGLETLQAFVDFWGTIFRKSTAWQKRCWCARNRCRRCSRLGGSYGGAALRLPLCDRMPGA